MKQLSTIIEGILDADFDIKDDDILSFNDRGYIVDKISFNDDFDTFLRNMEVFKKYLGADYKLYNLNDVEDLCDDVRIRHITSKRAIRNPFFACFIYALTMKMANENNVRAFLRDICGQKQMRDENFKFNKRGNRITCTYEVSVTGAWGLDWSCACKFTLLKK